MSELMNQAYRPHLVSFLTFALFLSLSVAASFGQQKNGKAKAKQMDSPASLAVDVIFLNDRSRLYGVITEKTDQQIQIVIERDWFSKNDPQRYKEHLEQELEFANKANKEMVDRIESWIAELTDQPDLVFFLENEKTAAEERLANPDIENFRFARLVVSQSDIRKLSMKSDLRRHLATVAWFHNLQDVSTRSADSLNRELRKNQIDIAATQVDFSSDVPVAAENDQQWSIRKAIVEHEFLEPLRFQGTGDMFVRDGEQANPMAMIQQLLGAGSTSQLQQIGEELGLPEFTRQPAEQKAKASDWWKKQAAIADKEKKRSFSITRLNQNLLSSTVEVQAFFFVKDDRDRWIIFRQFSSKADADQQSADDIEALKEDPQVKQALEMAEALGLGSGGQIEKALRHGVATQSAMQEARSQLVEFLQPFGEKLTSPTIVIPAERR